MANPVFRTGLECYLHVKALLEKVPSQELIASKQKAQKIYEEATEEGLWDPLATSVDTWMKDGHDYRVLTQQLISQTASFARSPN